MHELQMPQPLFMRGAQILYMAFEKIRAFGGQHHAGAAGHARIHVRARTHHAHLVRRGIGVHLPQAIIEVPRQITRRGVTILLDARACAAYPAPVRHMLPRHQRHALCAHLAGESRIRKLAGDHPVVAVHVRDGYARLRP